MTEKQNDMKMWQDKHTDGGGEKKQKENRQKYIPKRLEQIFPNNE